MEKLHQTDITKINYDLFLKAVKQVKAASITSRAPLGYSSDDIMLHGNKWPMISVVSVRNHSGMYSMLITTEDGRFLFNGGFSITLPTTLVASMLYKIFKSVWTKII